MEISEFFKSIIQTTIDSRVNSPKMHTATTELWGVQFSF